MWSSPVAVYTPSGKSYIIACDTIGQMFLLDGKTGDILDTINLGTNIEASPAVFNDTIVVGTRGQKIYAVQIN
jgi:outer membrane protein assembly factor BamB